jgi:4'-phosphopantetheinyl transferase
LLRGRLVAKRLLCALLPGCTPLELSVLPDEAGAPVVWREGRRLAWSLSISHTSGLAAAAAVELPGAVGIDVERVIESPRLIAEDYLTADERHLAGADGALGVTRVWCVKEAVLKAVREGLRLPASAVVVAGFGAEAENGWRRVELARWPGGDEMRGWVREIEGAVLAVAGVGAGAGEVSGGVGRV